MNQFDKYRNFTPISRDGGWNPRMGTRCRECETYSRIMCTVHNYVFVIKNKKINTPTRTSIESYIQIIKDNLKSTRHITMKFKWYEPDPEKKPSNWYNQ